MASTDSKNKAGDTWLIDSGCSNHMSGNKELFHSIEEVPHQTIRLGDGNILKVVGVGIVLLQASSGKNHILSNVQFVPNLAHNLLSILQLMSTGYNVEFSGGECIIKESRTSMQVARVRMILIGFFHLMQMM
ncbi:RNA-directed DNA polymerase protein [Dioscorea alata]|uniref:RNA-directed DNA polymerase protein n=1 Tax=Dioscorea alata TaxID=55571 RepID=A0ACB7U5G0_DIOAL|nr:RNA-directed DNA polymerase protein [Dioscorea alata]